MYKTLQSRNRKKTFSNFSTYLKTLVNILSSVLSFSIFVEGFSRRTDRGFRRFFLRSLFYDLSISLNSRVLQRSIFFELFSICKITSKSKSFIVSLTQICQVFPLVLGSGQKPVGYIPHTISAVAFE